MPYINIEISGCTLSPDQAHTLTANMTRIMDDTANKEARLTSVRIGQAASAWAIGGTFKKQAVYAHMDIHITHATNTLAERAELVRQGHEELKRILDDASGELDDATYVIVHEHPAENWGYGGRTQAARK